MSSLPSIDSLRCFCEAARLLSFRRAARSVALTPAALGQRIKQLEEQLGTPLFVRSTRHMALTPEGFQLLPRAQKAILAAEDCTRTENSPPAAEEWVLGTRHELGMSWIIPMLPMLRSFFPHVTFHIYFGSGLDLLNRLRIQEIHCAVGSMRTADPRMDSFALHPEHYVFVANPALLKKRRLNSFDEAGAHTLIDINSELPLFQYWRETAGAVTPRFGKILQMGTIAAVRHEVVRGVGVAVLPEYLISRELKSKRLVQLWPGIRCQNDHFRLFFRTDDRRRPHYENLAKAMRSRPLS